MDKAGLNKEIYCTQALTPWGPQQGDHYDCESNEEDEQWKVGYHEDDTRYEKRESQRKETVAKCADTLEEGAVVCVCVGGGGCMVCVCVCVCMHVHKYVCDMPEYKPS